MKVIPILMVRLVTVASLLAVSPSSVLAAQARGSLAGIVVDEMSGRPLEGARVSLLDTDFEAVTDEAGRFLLTAMPSGEVTLRAELPGYVSVVELVLIGPEELGFLRLVLPPVDAVLEGLLVSGRGYGVEGPDAVVLPPSDDHSKTAAHLLTERVPGLQLYEMSGNIGGGSSLNIRGTGSILGGNAPVIFVDGLRVTDRAGVLHVLEMIPASTVARIRVLRGPAAAARFGDAVNGVIYIETRRGGGQDQRRR